MFNIDFAVGVFRHVYLVNVWGIVSAAKCLCTNYQSPELVHTHFHSIKLSYSTDKNMNSSMNNDDLKEGGKGTNRGVL